MLAKKVTWDERFRSATYLRPEWVERVGMITYPIVYSQVKLYNVIQFYKILTKVIRNQESIITINTTINFINIKPIAKKKGTINKNVAIHKGIITNQRIQGFFHNLRKGFFIFIYLQFYMDT